MEMSEMDWQPGDRAMARVRGAEGVEVTRTDDAEFPWHSDEPVPDYFGPQTEHLERHVKDARRIPQPTPDITSGVNAGPVTHPDGTDDVPDEAKGSPPCSAGDSTLDDLRAAVVKARFLLTLALEKACPGPHSYVQHRDGKSPWCVVCKRNRNGDHMVEQEAEWQRACIKREQESKAERNPPGRRPRPAVSRPQPKSAREVACINAWREMPRAELSLWKANLVDRCYPPALEASDD